MISKEEFQELKVGDHVLLNNLEDYSIDTRYRFENQEVIISSINDRKTLFLARLPVERYIQVFSGRDIEAIIYCDIKQDFDMQTIEKFLSELT